MTQLQHTRTRNQPFTIRETDTEEFGMAVVARTKRYRFYWLLGEKPMLLRILDVDGTDVTGSVDPPDGMREYLAQYG